jgi:NAD+ kinase
VKPGSRVRARRGALPVKVVRLGQVSFTDRLVSKFHLPVRSLRESSPPPDDLDMESEI